MNATTKNEIQQVLGDNAESGNTAKVRDIQVEELFRKHYVNLVRFTQRYVRNVDDARDVVQATFIEAIRCSSRYNGSSQPSTWLFGIALNLARNHARKHYVASTRHVEERLLNDLLDLTANPADLVENQQLANSVEKMLSKLPQRLRETFELVFENEAAYAEAAEKMRIPVGTVRSRISRLRKKIHAIVN